MRVLADCRSRLPIHCRPARLGSDDYVAENFRTQDGRFRTALHGGTRDDGFDPRAAGSNCHEADWSACAAGGAIRHPPLAEAISSLRGRFRISLAQRRGTFQPSHRLAEVVKQGSATNLWSRAAAQDKPREEFALRPSADSPISKAVNATTDAARRCRPAAAIRMKTRPAHQARARPRRLANRSRRHIRRNRTVCCRRTHSSGTQ